jgi:hypothetical protein
MRPISFKRHRFSADVIRYAAWLYSRFTLSFRKREAVVPARRRIPMAPANSGGQAWLKASLDRQIFPTIVSGRSAHERDVSN